MSRPAHSSGFTLVELLVAATLSALIAGAVVLVLGNLTATQQRIDRQAELQARARAAINSIAIALRNAYRPVGNEHPVLEGTDDWAGDMPDDRIRFFTISRRVIRPGQPESDVHEVEFRIGQASDDGPSPGHTAANTVLFRRTDPTRNEPPDGGGVLERVAAGVVGLDFQYLDGAQWQNEWPVSRTTWPQAIRVRVIVMGDRPTDLYTATRLVDFPRYPQSTQPAQNAPQGQTQATQTATPNGEAPRP